MIEVTSGMIAILGAYVDKRLNEVDMITKVIELYEVNKPKTEPVGYAYPSQYAEALENEGCFLVFVVPVTNLDTGEESSLPLYTTPPTREPLSEEEIEKLVPWQGDPKDPFFNRIEFARAIEKAHGIGVGQ